jgi:hypothetical protein
VSTRKRRTRFQGDRPGPAGLTFVHLMFQNGEEVSVALTHVTPEPTISQTQTSGAVATWPNLRPENPYA